MKFELFINFDGNCHEAVEFYAKVFNSEVLQLMTFDQMPPSEDYTVADADKNKVMYCSVEIFGCTVMFCDNPAGMPLIAGNNISPTLVTADMEEIKRIFNLLAEGGKIEMELAPTFWSDLYGIAIDKFGIIWQLSHDSGKEY